MSYSYNILKELRDLYRKCGEINDTELSNTIIDLNIDMNKYRIFIDRIIARQFAFAYLKFKRKKNKKLIQTKLFI